jgi:uncharacterized protein YndB with AHSA1/START domain
VIDRPVEEVFAYVADVTNGPAWHTDILEARKTTEGPVGMGTAWHTRFKPSMGISEADMEVVSFEPNRVLAMTGEVGPHAPHADLPVRARGWRDEVHSPNPDQRVRLDEDHAAGDGHDDS